MNSDLVLPFLVCLVRQTSPRLTGHIYTTNAVFKYIEHSRAKILVHVLGPPRAIRRPAYRRSQSETLSRVRPRRSVSAHPRRHQPLATRASGAGTVKGTAAEIGSHPPQETRDEMPPRPRRVALGWIDWTRFGDPARGGGTGRFRKWARSLGPRTLQQDGETGIGISDPARFNRLAALRHVPLPPARTRHCAFNRRAGGRAAPRPSTERTSSLASLRRGPGRAVHARPACAGAWGMSAIADPGAGPGRHGVRSLSDSRHLISCENI